MGEKDLRMTEKPEVLAIPASEYHQLLKLRAHAGALADATEEFRSANITAQKLPSHDNIRRLSEAIDNRDAALTAFRTDFPKPKGDK